MPQSSARSRGNREVRVEVHFYWEVRSGFARGAAAWRPRGWGDWISRPVRPSEVLKSQSYIFNFKIGWNWKLGFVCVAKQVLPACTAALQHAGLTAHSSSSSCYERLCEWHFDISFSIFSISNWQQKQGKIGETSSEFQKSLLKVQIQNAKVQREHEPVMLLL